MGSDPREKLDLHDVYGPARNDPPPPAAPDREGDGTTDYEEMRTRLLVSAMGGEGECLAPSRIRELWLEFSADFCASDLLVGPGTMGNFAAWLIGKLDRSAPTADTERERIAREWIEANRNEAMKITMTGTQNLCAAPASALPDTRYPWIVQCADGSETAFAYYDDARLERTTGSRLLLITRTEEVVQPDAKTEEGLDARQGKA